MQIYRIRFVFLFDFFEMHAFVVSREFLMVIQQLFTGPMSQRFLVFHTFIIFFFENSVVDDQKQLINGKPCKMIPQEKKLI